MSGQGVYSILSLDIGEQRTGVALANSIARIASPLVTLNNPENLLEDVADLIKQHDVKVLVVGLPRNVSGDDTQQTTYVRERAAKIEEQTGIAVNFIDEALTSVKAENELKARKKPYQKEDIDMLAATYILEDFLHQYGGSLHV